MSRLLVAARASFNLFSSACKRRWISPVWAEVNWLSLDEADIADILLCEARAQETFYVKLALRKRPPDAVCSRRSWRLWPSIAVLLVLETAHGDLEENVLSVVPI